MSKHLNDINIKSIQNNRQRYPTVGDWWFSKNKELEVRVSKMSDWRYEFLVVYHELAEVMLCKQRGITQKSVDEFDIKYEQEREQGLHDIEDEPGFDKLAPYRKEHAFATKLEKMMAKELGVDWNEYTDEVNNL